MSSSAIAAGNVREHKAELNKSRGRETSSNQASQIWDIVYGVAMKMRKTQTVIPASAGIHRVSMQDSNPAGAMATNQSISLAVAIRPARDRPKTTHMKDRVAASNV